MADINLTNLTGLSISGSELFEDSESFTIEFSDEVNLIGGGIFVQTTPDIIVPVCTNIDGTCINPNRF